MATAKTNLRGGSDYPSAVEEMVETLRKIVTLLRRYNLQSWAAGFESCAADYAQDREHVRYCIRCCFGGMGSLNDIVLEHPDGSGSIADNEELEGLRTQLWELLYRDRWVT